MISEKARFRHARKLERVIGYRIPDLAFHGTVLEAIVSRLDFDRLDPTHREQLLSFFNSFLKCTCRDTPFCGCPEKAFAREIIELRENGLDHRNIAAYLLEEYGIDVYPADLLSFLEETVHELEALRDIARLQQKNMLLARTEEHIALIER